jgi:hypothetical protein
MAEEMTMADAAVGERRKRQRFVAKRWGNVCFWVVIDGSACRSMTCPWRASVCPSVRRFEPRTFPFVLQLDGIPDEVRGVAETMNFVLGTDGGCSAAASSPSRATAIRLHDWLTVHVIATATVRISEREAAEIVSGPSLI